MKSYKTIQVDRKQVRLHRYLMQQKEGRVLGFNEVVHHIDEDIHNNDLSNLKIVSRSEHIRIHPEIKHKATAAKTKYFVEKDLLNELHCEKRLTLREISEITKVPQTTLFFILKRNNIKRNK